MPALSTSLRFARDLHASSKLMGVNRRMWIARIAEASSQYWPTLGKASRVHISRRVRAGREGYLVRGKATHGTVEQTFWIKWSPRANPQDQAQTIERMNWWRSAHSELTAPVPRILDHWPDQAVLLIEGRPGKPLSRIMLRPGAAHTQAAAKSAHRLGRWLRSYADGHGTYAADVTPLLGDQVERTAGGRLIIDARRLLESRIQRAQQAAAALSRRGMVAARQWQQRVEVSAAFYAIHDHEPAGFVHGDMKPENVLARGRQIAVIDWWAAPRVSWPLTDVACMAANLWLMQDRRASAVWRAFASAYFGNQPDIATQRIIELLAVSICLDFFASGLNHVIGRITAEQRWGKLIKKLVDPHTSVAPLHEIIEQDRAEAIA